MFRKPKKGKSSSQFRQSKKNKRNIVDTDGDNDVDKDSNADHEVGNNESTRRRKKFRKRSSSSSDEDEAGGDRNNDSGDDDTNTSALLQQIRNETKKKGRGNSNSGNNSSAPSSTSLMHEFKSSKKVVTQQDLATSLAQHHPSTNKDKPETENVVDEQTQTQNQKALSKPERNKFLAGPIRASKFIRTTSRFDYEPEICKDYKDTGFCGFGDSCIYLHDRTNMKTGKALEEEWEAKKRAAEERKEREINMFCTIITGDNNNSGGTDGSAKAVTSLEEDGLPFACHICRGAFEEPVVTQCSHYFCQSCILKRVRDENDPTCPICTQDTNGVFNYPTKLVNKKKRLVGRNGTWEEFANAMKQ